MRRRVLFSLVSLGVVWLLNAVGAAPPPAAAPRKIDGVPPGDPPRVLTRLFFQNHQDRIVRWADVRLDDQGRVKLSAPADIAGWKPLDVSKQTLVQMAESHGFLMVGVRDQDGGKFESGWVLANTGVTHQDHGDHGHWYYKTPAVVDQRLDKEQGNPAHLYVYDGCFFLANDAKNGYTRLNPSKYDNGQKDEPLFIKGGGNHITLAVVGGKVGYSTWIDGGGLNKGRVDVTPIRNSAPCEPAYAIVLPSGGLHGATAAAGKVFFAPLAGLCWVEADLNVTAKPDQVTVHTIDLGKDGEKPLRTGAFATHDRWVLCVTGQGSASKLVVIDAAAQEPTPQFVSLAGVSGTKPVTPVIMKTAAGRYLALVFHDRSPGSDAQDSLDVVDLDPNRDGNWSDAQLVKSLPVGPSAVSGHFGHHDAAADADGRCAFITNPGDGTIAVLSLKDLEFVATFKVGGMPTMIIARGGLETED
jgi:hypothetical protein